MLLLIDIGNTHTHLGLADARRIRRHAEWPTAEWAAGKNEQRLQRWLRQIPVARAALCSVVPAVTPAVRRVLRRHGALPLLEVTHRTVTGIGIRYPKPATIGPDRLANAVAVRHQFGAPALAIDFGTAVTFDVVDSNGDYIGGIIAPGLAAMTHYLHDQTALLPRIRIRETHRVIGRSTAEAMRIGAVQGYRGLVRELIHQLQSTLHNTSFPIVATGGYAALMAHGLPEITAVQPHLTLEGLRLECVHQVGRGLRTAPL